MTESQAAAIWPVMKAFSEGKKVQFDCDGWKDATNPGFCEAAKWRIKPELFEGKFVLFEDGHAVIAKPDTIASGNYRIVTLREVEAK